MQGLGTWNEITPATYQRAMEAGTAAGEARDRLSLAYAQLQSQEQRAAEQAQAKLTLAHATLEARQQQQAYLRI